MTRPMCEVIPTHVGVDLSFQPECRIVLRYPHARGGGPFPMRGHRRPLIRYPHARGGGPDRRDHKQGNNQVVPTHVGVDLRGLG